MKISDVANILFEIAHEEMTYNEMGKERMARIAKLSKEPGIKIMHALVQQLGKEQDVDQGVLGVTGKLYVKRAATDKKLLDQMKILYKLEFLTNLHDRLAQIISKHVVDQYNQDNQWPYDKDSFQKVIKERNSLPLPLVYQFIQRNGEALVPAVERNIRVFFENIGRQEEKIDGFDDVNSTTEATDAGNSATMAALSLSKALAQKLQKSTSNKQKAEERVNFFKQQVSTLSSAGIQGFSPEKIRQFYKQSLLR